MPVSCVLGGKDGVALGVSGLRFHKFRLIARSGDDERSFDKLIDASDLEQVKAALGPNHQSRIDALLAGLSTVHKPMSLAGGLSRPYNKPLVMGILNVTPDSFSDGGQFFDSDIAIKHARAMVAAGADIIDIGGESTRPGAIPVWEGDEADRVVPVIEALTADKVPLSIDTRHSFVMKAALKAGAHIINDVTALTYDPESIDVVAGSNTPVILMHSKGTPKTMQDAPEYGDVLLDVYDYLEERIQACETAGIDRSRIITDPGIGFGKRVVQDNLALINGISIFHTLGCPILLGASRKRFIGAITGAEEASDRMAGSLTAALLAIESGVQIVRVHDVVETAQAVKLQQAMFDNALMHPPFSS